MTRRRILHTSDWHLGQSFHGFDRTWEHAQFLEWLLEQVEAHQVDALFVTGDIFDTVSPSNVAQRQWFDFLGELLRKKHPCEVVAIAGNHDSAQRLDAPEALTRALGLHVVGGARGADGAFDVARLVVPLGARGAGGVWGHVAAVPYLRADDLGTVGEWQAEGAFIQLMRRRLGPIFERLDEVTSPGQARFALFHGVVAGKTEASVTERDIRIGNSDGVPGDLFPESLTYLALGHLHKPQRAGGHDHFQYAGSPLPLHVSESEYNHRVILVTVEDGRREEIRSLPVPKRVRVVRIPTPGNTTVPHEETLALVEALQGATDLPLERQPFLEVRYLKDKPRPGFSNEVALAAAKRGYRLTTTQFETPNQPDTPQVVQPTLDELTPEQVFIRLHEQRYASAPDEALLAAFRALLAELPTREVQ